MIGPDWPFIGLVAAIGGVFGLLVALFTEERKRTRSDSEPQ